MIQNYRINFGGENINYKDNFSKCREYFPILERLYQIMENDGVIYAWHFFEPYVEFTWVSSKSDEYNELIIQDILSILVENNLKPTLIHRPKDGVIVDWYCKSPEEQRFGMESYALSAKMAMLFWKYRDAIERGCGEDNQFMRRPHVLANQIGMNYHEEGEALRKRGLLAKLFWEIGDHSRAVAEYEKQTGEKYL